MSENIKVATKKKQCWGCCLLQVEVGTTGACGGDSGHGGRTYLRLEQEGGNIEFSISERGDAVEMRLGGDSELDVLIEALEFAVNVLKSGKTHDDVPKMGTREFV